MDREDHLWQCLAAILLCFILVAGCSTQERSKDQSKAASHDVATSGEATSGKVTPGEATSQEEAKGLVMAKTDKQPSVKRKVIEPVATTTAAIDPDIVKKLDPALKKKLAELTAEGRMDEEIGMIGKYAGVKPQELRQKVANLGCSVGTVTTSLFTVECEAGDVLELAKFQFVKYLELEQEVYPLGQSNSEGGGRCGRCGK